MPTDIESRMSTGQRYTEGGFTGPNPAEHRIPEMELRRLDRLLTVAHLIVDAVDGNRFQISAHVVAATPPTSFSDAAVDLLAPYIDQVVHDRSEWLTVAEFQFLAMIIARFDIVKIADGDPDDDLDIGRIDIRNMERILSNAHEIAEAADRGDDATLDIVETGDLKADMANDDREDRILNAIMTRFDVVRIKRMDVINWNKRNADK